VAPDADLKSTLNNNPKFTFYVIDTNNTLQYKFEQRFIGDLPAASEVQSMVDAKKLPTLSKDSITAYLDYTNTQNAVSSVSVNWTNPTNGFNADRVGFYAEVFQSTPGNGLRGPNSIIAANKPPNNVGTDGIWNSDNDIAAEIDALTGTNFFWRLNSITKADDGAGNCTGNYLVSSLNVGTPRAKNTMSNQSLGGNWLGTDTQATACKKVVGIGSPPTYPAAAKTYLHREIWLRTYTTTNARVYRYYANKNFS
jgi:hypothetical protein